MKFRLNPKYMPYYVALVQASMIAYAGVRYFDGLWGWFIGAGVGSAVSLSLAVASSRISDIAKKRQRLARTMYVLLYVLSPAVVALTIVAPQSVYTIIAWAAAPDLAIGLTGAIIGKGMVAEEKPVEASAKPVKPAFSCSVAGCSFVAKSQAGLNGHQSKHKPKVSGYKVSFEPVIDGKKKVE